MMAIIPTQKTGSACPRTAMNFTPLSQKVSRLVAPRTPRKSASIMLRKKEVRLKLKVLGSNSKIMSVTGRCFTNDSPRSPWARSVTKIQYCSGSDLSRPMSALIRSISSAVEVLPAISSAGSPEARTRTKINMEMPMRATNAWSNRIMMKRPIYAFLSS
ncbi:hypothetical protein ES703_62859 [subsurface metagenome]